MRKDGKPLIDAAAEAARMRLRPIIMTSPRLYFWGYYLWHLLQAQGKVVSTLSQRGNWRYARIHFLGYFLCTTVLCLCGLNYFHEKAHVVLRK